MLTPKELRKLADDCLKLARESDQIYAKMALIEMGTEFRVMAQHLEREATRRTADRIRRRVDVLRRSVGGDLPLKFHPATIRASAVDTPIGAV